jgi:hypothetical protein
MEGEISDKTKEEIQKLDTKEDGYKGDEETKKQEANRLEDNTTPIKHELSKTSAVMPESIKEQPDEDDNKEEKEGGGIVKGNAINQDLQKKYYESDARFK